MTALVYLPGLLCDQRLYSAAQAEFGGQVIAITEHDTVQALAAEVLAQAPERFALLGLSMGGIVAMEVYRQAPERLTGLALLDTNPFAELASVQAGRAGQIARAHRGELRSMLEQDIVPRYFYSEPAPQALVALCLEMADELGPEVFERQSLALRERPDQLETLKTVDVPSLILHGRHDQLCPADRHQAMHQAIPQAQYQIIEHAGHLPTLEQPEATNQAIAEWLAAVSRESTHHV